jgi:hypothetical protein
MLEHSTPSAPQPSLPLPWAKIAGWLIIVGLVVAYIAVPSFRNNVVYAWGVTKTFFLKLFGF